MWEKVWNTDKIAYGGDYNPEQWPEETWEEDMRLLKLAHIECLSCHQHSRTSGMDGKEISGSPAHGF